MTVLDYPVFGDGEIEDAFNKEAKQLQLRLWKKMSRMD